MIAIALVLLAAAAFRPVEIGRGDFTGAGRTDRVYYQILGTSGTLDAARPEEPVLYCLRIYCGSETIGRLSGVRFPLASSRLTWRRRSKERPREIVLLSDAAQHWWIHHVGSSWAISSPEEFTAALATWLR